MDPAYATRSATQEVPGDAAARAVAAPALFPRRQGGRAWPRWWTTTTRTLKLKLTRRAEEGPGRVPEVDLRRGGRCGSLRFRSAPPQTRMLVQFRDVMRLPGRALLRLPATLLAALLAHPSAAAGLRSRSSSIPTWPATWTTWARSPCCTPWPTSARRRSWPWASPRATNTWGPAWTRSTPGTAGRTSRSAISAGSRWAIRRTQASRTESKYAAAVAKAFPHDLAKSSDAPDAALLYRKVLAAQADASVVIVSVGFLTNLKSLLDTPADAISPLDRRGARPAQGPALGLHGREVSGRAIRQRRRRVQPAHRHGGLGPGPRRLAHADRPVRLRDRHAGDDRASGCGRCRSRIPCAPPIFISTGWRTARAGIRRPCCTRSGERRAYWTESETGLCLMHVRGRSGYNEWIPTAAQEPPLPDREDAPGGRRPCHRRLDDAAARYC